MSVVSTSGNDKQAEKTLRANYIPQGTKLTQIWRAMGDSNARPLAPEANALSN